MTNQERPFNRAMAIDRTKELGAIRQWRKLTKPEREEFQTLHEGLLADNRAAMWRQKQAQPLDLTAQLRGGIN